MERVKLDNKKQLAETKEGRKRGKQEQKPGRTKRRQQDYRHKWFGTVCVIMLNASGLSILTNRERWTGQI